MKIVRIKARVVADPCPYRETCCGACEWCETHSYSEACVPMLQARCNLLGERWLATENAIIGKRKGCERCSGVSFSETPFVVITQKGTRIEVPFHYCPKCGRKLGAAE